MLSPAPPALVVVEVGDDLGDAVRIAVALREAGISCETITPDMSTPHLVRVRLSRDAGGRLRADVSGARGERSVEATWLLPALGEYLPAARN